MATLVDLDDNDMLFIDSTHTVKPGSEVNKIILEVLPRLREGVWIHFHDILFPYDYRRSFMTSDLFCWLESTLLHAFLINNDRFEVQLAQSMLHYGAQDELKACFPSYDPRASEFGLELAEGTHFPASTYLRTRAVPVACQTLPESLQSCRVTKHS